MIRGSRSPVDTVVFDLDGTLVDSVYEHVRAWQAAFAEVGLRVSGADLHRSIGMGGDRLVTHVAGDSAEWAVGDDVRRVHDERFRELIPAIHETRGASELLLRLAATHQLVLASSGNRESTEALLSIVDAASELRVVITGDDVENSKPAPDLIQAAMSAVDARHAVVIGDSTWDAQSAQAAGVSSIGLLCGGIDEGALLAAGAGSVHADPEGLLAQLAHTELSPEQGLLKES